MAGAGRYRDLVDIQIDVSTNDSTQEDFSGVLFADVPCQIEAVGGIEQIRGRQIEAGVEYVVEMHYLEGVEPTMRLLVKGGMYDGKSLNISHVLPKLFKGQAQKMELFCDSKVT